MNDETQCNSGNKTNEFFKDSNKDLFLRKSLLENVFIFP